eukprot:CAMPEP_0198360126 /NCGR_PEP_ID=MMETSP1450-20131203/137186_1 /TAXON_ID=753684 ORGANISM="Madagascaria erythrocladiodes, Strain CCMP3234" /NCGR_SAMPLE_ID=MMETSP1450 /ASSEMBLY_ACC=CAM_ASM_001115 /LENGTH=122 /DNA_ID=CAMNT_0044067095 /DNA_START=17 /DNA_END=385 /DNA_ORIENTATION=-
MTVFSKVLWGSMQVTSYDFVEEATRRLDGDTGPRYGLAKAPPAKTVAAGEVSVLRPWIGNVHSFRANEWTAVFDLAIPPYDYDRPCTYYRADVTDSGLASLQPTSCPESYSTVSKLYRGELA